MVLRSGWLVLSRRRLEQWCSIGKHQNSSGWKRFQQQATYMHEHLDAHLLASHLATGYTSSDDYTNVWPKSMVTLIRWMMISWNCTTYEGLGTLSTDGFQRNKGSTPKWELIPSHTWCLAMFTIPQRFGKYGIQSNGKWSTAQMSNLTRIKQHIYHALIMRMICSDFQNMSRYIPKRKLWKPVKPVKSSQMKALHP